MGYRQTGGGLCWLALLELTAFLRHAASDAFISKNKVFSYRSLIVTNVERRYTLPKTTTSKPCSPADPGGRATSVGPSPVAERSKEAHFLLKGGMFPRILTVLFK